MTTVLAQGTFDLLHPGHVHYLREAADLGDRLAVIVANEATVDHKTPPVVPGEQRRELVAALDPVDRAHLGHPEDMSVPVRRIDPDVVALGGDQHHDEDAVRGMLEEWGIDAEVRRVSLREAEDEEILSSSTIARRVVAERGPGVGAAGSPRAHSGDD